MAVRLRRPALAVASLRLVLVLLAGLPAWLAAGGPLRRVFSDPWIADAGTPLPGSQFVGVVTHAGGPALAGIAVGVLFLFLVHQAFVGGAVAALVPPAPWRTRPRRWREILAAGAPWTWAMLRVTLLAAIPAALGLVALAAAFSLLGRIGDRHGWTAQTLFGVLVPVRLVLATAWLALVGAFAMTVRGRIVRGGDPRVRRALLPALRAWLRAPLAGALAPAALLFAGPFLGGLPVLAWRLAPPAGAAGLAAWMLLALLGLAAQAAAWTAALALATRDPAG